MCVAGVWHPTVSGLVAATADSFRAGYRAYHEGGGCDHGWAPDSFHGDGSFADKLAIVETILDDPDLSDFAHGCLAAGPVENLIGHALLDHVMSSAENRARWVPLLRVAYRHSEPPDVRRRLHALLGTTD